MEQIRYQSLAQGGAGYPDGSDALGRSHAIATKGRAKTEKGITQKRDPKTRADVSIRFCT